MESLCHLASPQLMGGEQSWIEILEEGKVVQPLTGRPHLIEILGCVSLMSQITIAALEAFERHEWRHFDALVGEQACQLRAARIKDLADLLLSSADWRQEIRRAREKSQMLLQQLPHLKRQIEKTIPSNREFKANYGPSIQPSTVCRQWEILQLLSEDIRFIVESYLLTQVKILDVKKQRCFYKIPDATDPRRLVRFNSNLEGQLGLEKNELVGKSKLEKLITCLQCDLASLSIGYLQREVRLLRPTLINQFAQEMINTEIRKDDKGRACAPCFYSLESLMQRITDKAQAVLIDITRWNADAKKFQRIKRLYAADPMTHRLQLTSVSLDRNHPVFVIIGDSVREDQEKLSLEEYQQMFDAYPLEEILAANWAQHEQYPGKMDQMHPPRPDERREEWTKKAEVMGCTPKNMSLFVVSHILCDRYGAALDNQELL